MKTLETLYQEILASDELKKGLAGAAKTPEGRTEWVKAQGCEATAEEIGAFLKEKRAKTGELSDDELESAAGGGCNAGEVALSVYSALVCAVDAIVSAIDDEYKRGEDNTLLCTDLNRIM